MISIYKDTLVPNTEYKVSIDNIDVEETSLILCYDINNPDVEVMYQAYYIINGKNFGE